MSSKDFLAKVRQFKELQVFIKELEDELDGIKGELVSEMTVRDTSEMVIDTYTVRYTPYTTSRIDGQALKKEMPEIAERFTTTTLARRFSIA